MVLLTPGPCMTSEAVRSAAAMPDLNHRDPLYQEMLAEVRTRLTSLYESSADWTACMVGGSGTAAVEAMISSCISTGPALVITNGYYSERVVDLLEVHGIPHKALSFDWLQPWDMGQIERELDAGSYEAVVCVHNETTTGRLNDIAALGALCKRRGVRCLVDAMSSFGVEPIDFGTLDAVASSANKCLHGIPGVSFVMLSPEMAARVRTYPSRTYYLSLRMYLEADTPLTPPVPAIAALRQALREMGSLEERRAAYLQLSSLIRDELGKRAFVPAIPLDQSSITLTCYQSPGNAPQWIEENRRLGFMLYGCKGDLRDGYFQVANMGELAEQDVADWLAAVDRLMSGGDSRPDLFAPPSPPE